MRNKTGKQYGALLLCLALLITQIPVALGDVHVLAANHTQTYGGLTIAADQNGVVTYTTGSGFTLTTNGAYTISGTWSGSLTGTSSYDKKAVITVPQGVTAQVTLSGASIDVKDTNYACAFAIEGDGTANITLEHTSTLISGQNRAGLEVPAKATVVIDGDNTSHLTATGGNSGAGIGGTSNSGSIRINGGNIIATGGQYCAGIGGGLNKNGAIRIYGGNIIATGGRSGAGIGGGSDGGSIYINGGFITATGSNGGAGIGGGTAGVSGNIIIEGDAQIKARGSSSNNLSSSSSSNGMIHIRGHAVVEAIGGGGQGAGIGGGSSFPGSGSGSGGAGIGGGAGVPSNNEVIISGNAQVTATGGTLAAGIGGGDGGNGGSITIEGNTLVFATGGAASFGNGNDNTDSTQLNLNQGIVFAGTSGAIYGDVTLPSDLQIPSDSALTVPSGSSLTIPDQIILTNGGIIKNYGTVNGTGSLVNDGTINDYSGGITAAVIGSGTFNKASAVEITFWKNGAKLPSNKALIGDTITIQANVQQKQNRSRTPSASLDQVVFRINGVLQDTVAVTSNGLAVSQPIQITGSAWTTGDNTITAEYGGSTNLFGNTGSAILTVTPPSYTISANPANLDFGSQTVGDTNVPSAQAVTIQNTGNSTVTGYQVMSNSSPSNFKVSYTSNIITAGGIDTFTVQPKAGLAIGTYEETLTITTHENTRATVTLHFVVNDKPVYRVTVETTDGGTATASPASATAGETIVLSATPDEGYSFDHWTATSGVAINNNQFTMPAQNVTVKAIFRSTDATLSRLQYQVDGGALNDVPQFTASEGAYHVMLPPSTPQNASVTLTGTPAYHQATISTNSGVTLSDGAGTAALTVTAEDKTTTKTYTVHFSVQAAIDRITVSPSALSFGTVTAGYSTVPAVQTVTILNTGNREITGYTVTTQATFTVSASSVAIPVGGTATFTVQPKPNLSVGVYDETLTIHTTNGTEAAVRLQFTVTNQPTYTITVEHDDYGTASASPASAAAGETVFLTATANSGYSFSSWLATTGVAITNNQFIMPAQNVTVKAIFTRNSSGGRSSSSSKSSTPQDSYTVKGNAINLSIARTDLQRLVDGSKSLTIQSDTVTMTFEPAALKAILSATAEATGRITFVAAPADLSQFPDAAAQIGSRPVYDFTICYQDSKSKTITAKVDFPTGSASIALNYTPAAEEATKNLYLVYVDDKGALTWLDKSSYNQGKVQAGVSHFSIYGVAYKTSTAAPTFTDIEKHWAKADIEFVAARSLITGMSTSTFSPNTTMTRGMFVTALGRLAGVESNSYQTSSFTDVKAKTYYAPYVEWAAQKNIVKGTGDKLFSPDVPVTREQMAVMMTNYATQMDETLPTSLAEVVFTDKDQISAWAQQAVITMQRSGVLKGKSSGLFDPQGKATRAEAAAMLHRFIELISK